MLARWARRGAQNVASSAVKRTCRFNGIRCASNQPSDDQSRSTQLPKPTSKLSPRSLILVLAGVAIVATINASYRQEKASPAGFTTYTITKKEPVSPTASIFQLEPASSPQTITKYQNAWSQGIWSVQIKQPQIQVVRAYTPLPYSADENIPTPKTALRFLIRQEAGGEVSGWLHRLPVGTKIELRGPNTESVIAPETSNIIFLAGGTGIAPALQTAYSLLNRDEVSRTTSEPLSKGAVHILWACRRREDCSGGVSDLAPEGYQPLSSGWFSWPSLSPKPQQLPAVRGQEQGLIVKELEALKRKYPGQVTVEYFVDEEGTRINEDALYRALARTKTSPPECSQLLISGPPGFVDALAGPKIWINGREEQGAVGGVLAKVLDGDHRVGNVWKI